MKFADLKKAICLVRANLPPMNLVAIELKTIIILQKAKTGKK